MQPAPPFPNDVFISYASQDAAWAILLDQALKAAGNRVFLDKARLVPGAVWESQLRQAAEQSRHIVVLWSNHAKGSDWVNREMASFDHLIHPNPDGQAIPGRLMIQVLLEGENRAYSSLQMISRIKDCGGYPGTPNNLPNGVWSATVADVLAAIGSASNLRPILRAIITLTAEECTHLNPQAEIMGTSLQTILARIGLASHAQLVGFYGPARDNWRPFGGALTIQTILNSLLIQLNAPLPAAERFRWDDLGAAFWGNATAAIRAEASRAASGPSVIVVDPLALYDSNIYRRFQYLKGCFDQPDCVIVALTPFPLYGPTAVLRTLLRDLGTPLFDPIYEPPIPAITHAHCSVSVADDVELLRTLRAGLGRSVQPPPPPAVQGFTKV